MKQIEFIYTFNSDREQQFAQYPFTFEILESEEDLKEYAIQDLNEEERNDILKISCCIDIEESEIADIPIWFKEANGKLWFEENRTEANY